MIITDCKKSKFLTRKEAALYLGVKPNTLAVWKTTKRYDIACYKIGSKAVYLLSDLEKFIKTCKVGGEDE